MLQIHHKNEHEKTRCEEENQNDDAPIQLQVIFEYKIMLCSRCTQRVYKVKKNLKGGSNTNRIIISLCKSCSDRNST